jgi:hypothetical protein
MTLPLKRWLLISAGVVGCMALLEAFRFSRFSFFIVFLVIVIAAALYHSD